MRVYNLVFPPELTWYSNCVFNGNKIKELGANSVKSCADACFFEPECATFTYNKKVCVLNDNIVRKKKLIKAFCGVARQFKGSSYLYRDNARD